MANAKLMKCLGTDDSVNSCDCCGRDNLKATVAFETESGDVVYFGVVCAARASGKSSVSIRAEARVADDAKADAVRKAADEARKAKSAEWLAHLVKITGGINDWSGRPCIASMIRAAGGFGKATEGFQW